MSSTTAFPGPVRISTRRDSPDQAEGLRHPPVCPVKRGRCKHLRGSQNHYQDKYHLPGTALARDTVDLLIASSALEIGSVLVSHDRIFGKIQVAQPALQVEDWAE